MNYHEVIAQELEKDYFLKYSKSYDMYKKGQGYFINKVSQAGRYFEPFPIYITGAKREKLETIDGEFLTDYWLGHFISVFGHSEEESKKNILALVESNKSFQTGQCNPNEVYLAEEISKYISFSKYIYTNTGAQATMIGIMCAFSYTKRSKIFKVSGGWHGVQPWSLKGVKDYDNLMHPEFSGIPLSIQEEVLTIEYNNITHMEDMFKLHGDKVAVFILELVLGNSGMIVANPEYIKRCEELCLQYGVVLFVDEIVTAFRSQAGLLSSVYDINPDLVSLGKIISGGIPFAMLTGKEKILNVASVKNINRVAADMGTFTSHPMALASSLSFFKFLEKNSKTHYEKSNNMIKAMRDGLENIANKFNVKMFVTGRSEYSGIPDSSIGTIRFFKTLEPSPGDPRHWDPERYNNYLRDRILRLFLLNKNIYSWQGMGTVSSRHNHKDISMFLSVYEDFFSSYLDRLGKELIYD